MLNNGEKWKNSTEFFLFFPQIPTFPSRSLSPLEQIGTLLELNEMENREKWLKLGNRARNSRKER